MPSVQEPRASGDVTVAQALRKYAGQYLDKHGDRVPIRHRKVISLIMRCGTGALGDAFYRCCDCAQKHWIGRSCSDRHCPGCQKHKTQLWLHKQTAKLLPVQHFVVTFTVPQELRSLLRAHQRSGYKAIFDAGSQTIKTLLAKDKNRVTGQRRSSRSLDSDKVGFFGVLHTWGRDINSFNPHVHFVVPGGGVTHDGSKWIQTKRDQLFHPAPAKALYKKLFVQQLKQTGLYSKLPFGVLKKDWVVNIKPVGNGQAVLKYLAPYVYRVAISDNRIVSVDDEKVVYKVKPSGSKQYQLRSLPGPSFVRAFAQHILPSGFQKVRYYGFMSPNCKLQLENVRWLVWLHKGWTYWVGSAHFQPTIKKPIPQCQECGGKLELLSITNDQGRVIWRRAPPRGPP